VISLKNNKKTATRNHNNILVVGSGPEVRHEIALYKKECDIMAINDIGAYFYDPIQHWVSMHMQYIETLKPVRKWKGYNQDYTTHTVEPFGQLGGDADMIWKMDRLGGSSSLLGVLIALALGYTEVVLAGIPMDNSGHAFMVSRDYLPLGLNTEGIRQNWEYAKEHYFEGRVHSLSGWTAKLLK